MTVDLPVDTVEEGQATMTGDLPAYTVEKIDHYDG